MKDIEVGEYVRTKEGEIYKVIKIIEDDGDWDYYCCENNAGYFAMDVAKHSKQLIDIIEPGDILEIEEEGYEEKYECLKSDKGLSIYVPISDYYKRIEDLKIKRVLTKEQFRQNSYEVGGEKWD